MKTGMLRRIFALAPLAFALSLAACSRKDPPAPPLARVGPDCLFVPKGFGPAGTTQVKVEIVASGLEVPWGIAFLPGGDWLISERPGRVRLFQNGKLAPQPVVTIAATTSGEGGLLGIAASPAFATDHLFYVYVTGGQGEVRENRVVRYRLADDHRSATIDKVVVDHIAGAVYHDGGRLRFGPDGMLYVGTGDARQPDRSQLLASPNGKLLRLTPDGGVPADNPFPNNPAFLTGIRNTQGFDWLDPTTLVVVDHGPSGELERKGHDEVDVAQAGQNLGWPVVFGCETAEGKVAPVLSWEEAVPPGGVAIYTGSKISEWKGSVLVGTLASKHLHRVVLEPGNPRKVKLHEVYLQGDMPNGLGRLREVVMGPDGELYVTTSNCDGRGECPANKDLVARITR